MSATETDKSERALILAPTGNDAENAAAILTQFGFHACVCPNLTELVLESANGVGAILIAEEAFRETGAKPLINLLFQQPAWSDIPVIFIAYGDIKRTPQKFSELGDSGNISILERPFRPDTLRSALQVALRARRRQYQMRDLLEQQMRMHEQLKAANANLETEVATRTQELRATISELEAFSYSVSHDLRAPLRAMQGYSQYLLEDYSDRLDEQGRSFLRRILASSLKLDRLIQDILTYSRISRTDLPLVAVNVQNLVQDVVQSYTEFQPSRAEIEILNPLPLVLGHEASLTQVVSNFLGNAVKFIPEGTRPHIRVWSEENDGTVRLSFKDNGIGIHPDNHERIFRIFEKGDSASAYEGTGIGLAIVKKAIERMGGRIGVKSAPGKGAQFWIELKKVK